MALPTAFTRQKGNLWEQSMLIYYLRTWDYLAAIMSDKGHSKLEEACKEYSKLFQTGIQD
jgi:hypothetical protein